MPDCSCGSLPLPNTVRALYRMSLCRECYRCRWCFECLHQEIFLFLFPKETPPKTPVVFLRNCNEEGRLHVVHSNQMTLHFPNLFMLFYILPSLGVGLLFGELLLTSTSGCSISFPLIKIWASVFSSMRLLLLSYFKEISPSSEPWDRFIYLLVISSLFDCKLPGNRIHVWTNSSALHIVSIQLILLEWINFTSKILVSDPLSYVAKRYKQPEKCTHSRNGLIYTLEHSIELFWYSLKFSDSKQLLVL